MGRKLDELAVFDPAPPRTKTCAIFRSPIPTTPIDSPVMAAALAIITAQYQVTRALALAVFARRRRDRLRRIDAHESFLVTANADFNEACQAHTRARMSQAHAQQQLAVAVQAAEGIADGDILG